MAERPPVAFLSYVHDDDKYGDVSTLRERLADEVSAQIGTQFRIFQDRIDIGWGQRWRERIEESLDTVTFLIPIITPRFFRSQPCRDELRQFLEREKELRRNDLILPVYFIDDQHLNDSSSQAADELLQVIARHQYADWRDLRFEPFTSPQVRKRLEQLAIQIRAALEREQSLPDLGQNEVRSHVTTTGHHQSAPPGKSAAQSVTQEEASDQAAQVERNAAVESVLELGLTDNARFADGVEGLTDLLVRFRESGGASHIRVHHTTLDDRSFRVKQPDDYLRLQKHVREFEDCLNAALTIRYYEAGDMLSWQVASVVRLRDITFFAPRPPGERWFAWEYGKDRIVPFDIDQNAVRFIRTGYYEHVNGEGIQGLQQRPVWLVQINPENVWNWIIPSVVVEWIQSGDDPRVLEFNRWVFSDKSLEALQLPPNPEYQPGRWRR